MIDKPNKTRIKKSKRRMMSLTIMRVALRCAGSGRRCRASDPASL
jgi:hypothetical protein